jgi:hypothetical protein
MIDWHQSPWHESPRALAVYLEGYEADVFPNDTSENEWTWIVRATLAVSETPEIIDVGVADTPYVAQTAAERCLIREVL